MQRPSLVTRLLAEVLGTFGFFFLGFMGIAVSTRTLGKAISPGGVAAGFGVGLALMIFALGHLSGGHFNPAVSLGLAIGRQHPWSEVLPYWVAQLLGGLAAAGLVRMTFNSEVGKALVTAPGPGISAGTAIVLEAVATFLFLLVIQAVATDSRAPWFGLFAPVAIGGFIFIAATVVGPISGGSFNPARSLAPALIAGDFTDLWIYLVGPLIGGVAGGLVYSVFRAHERTGRSEPATATSP